MPPSPAICPSGVAEVYAVQSPHQPRPLPVSVQTPTGHPPPAGWPLLLFLPVEPEGQFQFGDPFQTLQALRTAERYRCVVAVPQFAQSPWYVDHPRYPQQAPQRHLVEGVLPALAQRYPLATQARDRLLLGYSKSGWGAFALLWQYPDVFGFAASWDAPFAAPTLWPDFGLPEAYGDEVHYRRNAPFYLLQQPPPMALRATPRLVLAGENFYGDGAGYLPCPFPGGHTQWMHQRLRAIGLPHRYQPHLRYPHASGLNGQPSGWEAPLIQALFELRASARGPA